MNAFLSNFPAPDVPAEERPWTPNRGLSDEKFKDECRAWDVNEAVFGPNMWRTYKTILRKDFELFDRYVHRHWDAKAEGGKVPEPFHFPITTFYGLQDKRCDEFKVGSGGSSQRQSSRSSRCAATTCFRSTRTARLSG